MYEIKLSEDDIFKRIAKEYIEILTSINIDSLKNLIKSDDCSEEELNNLMLMVRLLQAYGCIVIDRYNFIQGKFEILNDMERYSE